MQHQLIIARVIWLQLAAVSIVPIDPAAAQQLQPPSGNRSHQQHVFQAGQLQPTNCSTSTECYHTIGNLGQAACAVECALDAYCAAYHHRHGNELGSCCCLASLCQATQRWSNASTAGGGLYHAARISQVDAELTQIGSQLGGNLSQHLQLHTRQGSTLVGRCGHQGRYQNVNAGSASAGAAGGIQFHGSASSTIVVNEMASPFVSASGEFTLFVRATRRYQNFHSIHYAWLSDCASADRYRFVFKEFQGSVQSFWRRQGQGTLTQHNSPNAGIYNLTSFATVSIGVTMQPGAVATFYANGTVYPANSPAVSNNGIIPGDACFWIGANPTNSVASLLGTLHCYLVFNRSVSEAEFRQLDNYCSMV